METETLGGAYAPGIVDGMHKLGPAAFGMLFPSGTQEQRITVAAQKVGLLGLSTKWLHVQAA